MEKALIMDAQGVSRAITRITYEIIERNKGIRDLVIIGMRTRGIEIARRISQKIGTIEGMCPPMGTLDMRAYRDDIKADELSGKSETDIGFDINGKKVVLVDDVLYTGRSVRAGIDALMDLGRPKLIQLAVLIDRGHRELPIRPDYVGKNVPTSSQELIKVMLTGFDDEDKVIIINNGERQKNIEKG